MTWDQLDSLVILIALVVGGIFGIILGRKYALSRKNAKTITEATAVLVLEDLAEIPPASPVNLLTRTGSACVGLAAGLILALAVLALGPPSNATLGVAALLYGVGFLVTLCMGISLIVRLGADPCPRCGKRRIYYRIDQGRVLTCAKGDSTWQAGVASVSPNRKPAVGKGSGGPRA